MKHRILSLLLAVVLCIGMLPIMAFAAEQLIPDSTFLYTPTNPNYNSIAKTIAWGYTDSQADYYGVEIYNEADKSVYTQSVNGTFLSLADTGLPTGNYYFTVQAFNNAVDDTPAYHSEAATSAVFTYKASSSPTGDYYNITMTVGEGGAARSDMNTAQAGTLVNLTATPDIGYRFAGWDVVSGGMSLANASLSETTFYMPAANVELRANFEEITYYSTLIRTDLIGATATQNNVEGELNNLTASDTITLTITPNEGLIFDVPPRVTVTGAQCGSPRYTAEGTYTYEISDFITNAVITVSGQTVNQATTPYNIALYASGGKGTVAASHSQAVPGTTVTINVTPEAGYYFTHWLISKETISFADETNSTTTFVMPAWDVVNIQANIEDYSYHVTLNTDHLTGATASFNDYSVYESQEETLTITPESGKAFSTPPTVTADNATIGDLTLGADGSYTCVVTHFIGNTTITVSGEAVKGYAEIKKGDAFEFDGIRYTVTKYKGVDAYVADNEVAVCGNASAVGNVVVPQTVTYGRATFTVTAVEFPGFNCDDKITGITLPDTVTDIEGLTFNGCPKLTTVKAPGAIEIGHNAFQDCTGLTTVEAPNVTRIHHNAFNGCTALTEIDVRSVKTIGNAAFQLCTSLKTLKITDGYGVETIGDGAFMYCSALEKFIFTSVTSIGGNAFYSCAALKEVTIPSGVTYVGANAFTASGVEKLTIKSGASGFAVDANGNSNTFEACINLTDVMIEDGFGEIPERMFVACTALKSINIPASVNKIGNYVFGACEKLTSVNITVDDKLPEIAGDAFPDTAAVNFRIVAPTGLALGDDGVAGWGKLGAASYYRVRLYRDNSLVDLYPGSVQDYIEVTTNSCGLADYITEAGSYTFTVQAGITDTNPNDNYVYKLGDTSAKSNEVSFAAPTISSTTGRRLGGTSATASAASSVPGAEFYYYLDGDGTTTSAPDRSAFSMVGNVTDDGSGSTARLNLYNITEGKPIKVYFYAVSPIGIAGDIATVSIPAYYLTVEKVSGNGSVLSGYNRYPAPGSTAGFSLMHNGATVSFNTEPSGVTVSDDGANASGLGTKYTLTTPADGSSVTVKVTFTGGSSVDYTQAGSLGVPSISIDAGKVTLNYSVLGETDVKILYTTNGSNPLENGTLVDAGFSWSPTDAQTIKAVAVQLDVDNKITKYGAVTERDYVPSRTVKLYHTPAEGGTTGSGGSYEIGTMFSANARANSGYRFLHWKDSKGNIVSTEAGYLFEVTENVSLTAEFEKIEDDPAPPYIPGPYDDDDEGDDDPPSAPSTARPETDESVGRSEIQDEPNDLAEALDRGDLQPGETVTAPLHGLTETPESTERDIEQTVSRVDEPEAAAESKTIVGVGLLPVLLIVAAAAIGGGWFLWKRRRQDDA